MACGNINGNDICLPQSHHLAHLKMGQECASLFSFLLQGSYNVTVRVYNTGYGVEENVSLVDPVRIMNELGTLHITADLPIQGQNTMVNLGRTIRLDECDTL